MAELANIKTRLCDKPIVIDDWRRDDTYDGVFPKGSRDKSVYFSPENPGHVCLRGNYRYLFKLSRNHFPWQFWVETIAYRLGLIAGIEVPPAHIGVNNNYNPGETTYGALIEWFYDDRKDFYIEGGQLMIQLVQDYDRKKGSQHNFANIKEYFRYKKTFPRFQEHWAGVFTLDCLTGNTDRHHDNWGVVVKDARQQTPSGMIRRDFSPAFDNGTALGYEILEQNIDKYRGEKKLDNYLTNANKARHHMRWSLDENESLNFYDFMRKFVLEFPDTMPIIRKHLDFNRSQVEEVMNPLVVAVSDDVHHLSRKRLYFMIELIFRRKQLLEKVLGI
jgi:hypothetical protein